MHLRLLSSLILLLQITGCRNELVEPDNCVTVAEGWVPSRPEYLVMFKDGVPAQPTTNDLVTKYNLELRIQFAGDNGFSATVPTFAAFEGLRCEPVVAVMGWNAVVVPHGDP
jgi:hypothetical protein